MIKSPIELGRVTPNIGTMLVGNEMRMGISRAVAQRIDGTFQYWTWTELLNDVLRASKNLRNHGLLPGDRVGFVASNGYVRLVYELAVMCGGMVAVPVCSSYPGRFIANLLDYARVRGLVIEGQKLLATLPAESVPSVVIDLGERDLLSGPCLKGIEKDRITKAWLSVASCSMALVMFTAGTSGLPKGVQLSHSNLMAHQKALELLWKPEPAMRFLCHLPWHHSFGGLLERFFALHSGGCLAIDDSLGENIAQLLMNFSEIRPHIFFSVPRVYQEIMGRILADRSLESRFFHPELKFVFSAGAPLPASISDIFKFKVVPVAEGWGLTETLPCCTLTDLTTDRVPGVVGFPVPGVEIKLDDENEILVRGPSVTSGYLDRPEETAQVLSADGWFQTGDLGELTSLGLRITSRKDRMFKLNNGMKVFPAQIEKRIKAKCKYVKHAFVWGEGQIQPMLIVTPNSEFFNAAAPTVEDHGLSESQCASPSCPKDLASCLGACLNEVNEQSAGHERIKKAVLVVREPTIENGELTPSFRLVPGAVEQTYQRYIDLLSSNGGSAPPGDAFFIEIFPSKSVVPKPKSTSGLHYGLIGVGAIGSVLAAHLSQAGARVSLFCPSKTRLNLLRNGPIRVKGALCAEARLAEVHSELDQFLAASPDVILIATKSSQTSEVLRRILDHGVADSTVFVCCQNGLDVEGLVSGYFGKNRTLRMVLNLGCQPEQGNDIHVSFAYINFLSDVEIHGKAKVDLIAADLNAGGFQIETRKDYRAEVFKKVILNSSLSPVCAILGVTMKTAMEDPNSLGIVKQLLHESIHLGNVAGVNLPSDFYTQALNYLSKGGDHMPSMAIDIENGRRSENDDHGGRLLELARGLGVSMPVTETIYNLLSSRERRLISRNTIGV